MARDRLFNIGWLSLVNCNLVMNIVDGWILSMHGSKVTTHLMLAQCLNLFTSIHLTMLSIVIKESRDRPNQHGEVYCRIIVNIIENSYEF